MTENRGKGRARDAEKTRKIILDAAEKVFAEQGFDGARLDTIAQVADYNKSLIGQYFGDKLGLYMEVLKRLDSEMNEIQERVFTPMLEGASLPSDPQRLKAILETMVRELFDYMLKYPHLMRILAWEMAEGWQAYTKIASRLNNDDIEQFDALFGPLQKSELLRSDLPIVIQITMILQMCLSYLSFLPLYQMLLPAENLSSTQELERAREYIVALFVHGMLVDKDR